MVVYKALNDITSAPFLVFFSQLSAVEKNTENNASVTSLRTFVFLYGFNMYKVHLLIFAVTLPKVWILNYIESFSLRIRGQFSLARE